MHRPFLLRVPTLALTAALGFALLPVARTHAEGTNIDLNLENGPSGSGQHSASIIGPDGLNRASGEAYFGTLHAFAQSYSDQVFFENPGDNPDPLGARAFTSFNDLFTIKDPQLTGQQGVLNFRLDSQVSTRVQVQGPANTLSTGTAGGGLSVVEGPSHPLEVNTYNGTPRGNAFDFTVPVVFGEQNYLRVNENASTESFVQANDGSSVLAADSEALTWGGITSVTDGSGAPAKDWTVSSVSGFDYAVPVVPEGRTWLLLLGSLSALACARAARVDRRLARPPFRKWKA